jgi:hypothetical protein
MWLTRPLPRRRPFFRPLAQTLAQIRAKDLNLTLCSDPLLFLYNYYQMLRSQLSALADTPW